MQNDLINGVFRVLGDLPEAPRPWMRLAHSLVTGELVTIATPAAKGAPGPTAAQLKLEGEMFGEIAHPNIHRIVDWGAEEVFVAWEYQPMWTLNVVLDEGHQASVPAVLRLLTDIGTGLGTLHARGAVYRGLHPGRVYIARDGTAKIATCPDVVNTGRGRAVGIGPSPETPIRYLPPEQIDGSFDGRADIYTSAAMAYELITGRRLYGNSDPVTLAVQILKTTPEPPSRFRDDVPADIDDFLLHCLARDPSDRPATATAFLGHLRKIADAHPDAPRLMADATVKEPVVFAMSHRARPDTTDTASVVPARGLGALVNGRASANGYTANGRGSGGDTSTGRTDRHGAANGRALDVDATYGGATNGSAPRVGATNGNATYGSAGNAYGVHDSEAAQPAASYHGSIDLRSDGGLDPHAIALLAPDGAPLPITAARLVIGRGDAVASSGGLDLTPFDDSRVVSRNHAELARTESGWVCRDLGATNGTFVNGRRISPGAEVPVVPGDRLAFANVALTVEGLTAWATS